MSFFYVNDTAFIIQVAQFECTNINKPVSIVRYKLTCAHNKDSKRSAHPHSLIRAVSFPPEETLEI